MPKIKTSKTAAKRFKISGTGKILFEHSRLNHLMLHKHTGGRVRRMQMENAVAQPMERRRVRRLLPNSF
ncbi:MAG: 50S ribosomal protein L35 [Armatimonadetes bacterium]|nr:50S ribosomal protein L35 [Armatimonadota bacterium]